ncbi:hypothetical protein [Rhodococcus opacus]|uniref:hypothetical protein n=1 Tax=Rhodococcus opacus TaxID=37919 RepID=UPI0012FE2E70|nr:hypothetical protein [Rhodococcus opacus]
MSHPRKGRQMDYTQKAAEAVSSYTQNQNKSQTDAQRQRVLKKEAEDALRARLRQVKDSSQKK